VKKKIKIVKKMWKIKNVIKMFIIFQGVKWVTDEGMR